MVGADICGFHRNWSFYYRKFKRIVMFKVDATWFFVSFLKKSQLKWEYVTRALGVWIKNCVDLQSVFESKIFSFKTNLFDNGKFKWDRHLFQTYLFLISWRYSCFSRWVCWDTISNWKLFNVSSYRSGKSRKQNGLFSWRFRDLVLACI